jgi:hypothetical protein
MAEDCLRTRITVDAPAAAVFDVLASPERHLQIDGTGWLAECVDPAPLSEEGQVFRIGMYHDNHPDKTYLMSNKVVVMERPHAIGWMPGQADRDGTLTFGGWTWRYDLEPEGDAATAVTLTYDWSGVPTELREHIGFPPFPEEYLDASLRHLAEIAIATTPA